MFLNFLIAHGDDVIEQDQCSPLCSTAKAVRNNEYYFAIQIRSTWVGWGSLCVAGAGAYYFAKRSINADRLSRHEASQRVKQEAARQEAEVTGRSIRPKPDMPAAATSNSSVTNEIRKSAGGSKISKEVSTSLFGQDDVGSPSEETGHDPAATRHEPETDAQRVAEKGKYEATQLFRSRKGDRFS
ncbi:hypothetical protein LOZ53_000059 [Ophidiomyces ophidiicola]|nr:hypothetical protein LOZ55_000128 [Ophidiomyces ophidiicola]KAI1995813.1 hypothetical protein LOZ54_000492 [Ophidiomyces ophidiicola]KAI1998274.1 hypothetical protein LOZ53_000059 [Ophidiomyces ophidiicola]KAI2000841.1 hypothetical protein LOZ51_001127 [Ophidiomyces ophidiicola]